MFFAVRHEANNQPAIIIPTRTHSCAPQVSIVAHICVHDDENNRYTVTREEPAIFDITRATHGFKEHLLLPDTKKNLK